MAINVYITESKAIEQVKQHKVNKDRKGQKTSYAPGRLGPCFIHFCSPVA